MVLITLLHVLLLSKLINNAEVHATMLSWFIVVLVGGVVVHRQPPEMHTSEKHDENVYSAPIDAVLSDQQEAMTDTEFYASAYQVNGHVHFYQELSEADPRRRTERVVMSPAQNIPRPHLPIVSRCSVSDGSSSCDRKVAGMKGSPYLLFMPSSSSEMEVPSYSCLDFATDPPVPPIPYIVPVSYFLIGHVVS